MKQLQNRVDRVASQIPQPTISRPIFNYDLFTEAERKRLSALPLSLLADRLSNISTPADTTATLTKQEQEDFYCFLELQEALITGDEKEIAHWRLRLSMTLEEMVKCFRTLDTSKLPEGGWISVQRRHIIYSLSQIHHRVYSSGRDTEQMCVWIEYYQQQGWA